MENKFVILLLFSISVPILNSEQLVKISQGLLHGKIEKSRSGRSYSAFLGIPYGKPPIGDLRFRNPLPAGKWNGIRQAKNFENECLQTLFGYTFGKENCLFLNVFSPFLKFQKNKNINTSNETLLPVMVYIHGGTFFIGGSNNYQATYILDKDVILVTINFRQGILGFLSTGDLEAPGNFGLKDQVLALKWVQKNIRAFGGDRNQVTLIGQSSGSAAINLHTISNASNGLFHQYILQSGNALASWAFRNSSKILESVKKLAKFVSCPIENTKSLMTCLRKTDGQTLMFFANIAGLIVRNTEVAWVPTNELNGKDAFLTDNPENLIDQMRDLPFISGNTNKEANFFTYILHFEPLYNLLRNHLKNLLIDNAYYNVNANESFPDKLYKFYFNNSYQLNEKQKILDTYAKIGTDALFLYPTIRMMDKITPRMKSPSYFYNFGYLGDNFKNLFSAFNITGVAHNMDFFYIFPISFLLINTSDADLSNNGKHISKLLIDLWTSFAVNGVPTSEYLHPPNLWRPYKNKNNPYLQIGDETDTEKPTVKLSSNFLAERMNFWRANFLN